MLGEIGGLLSGIGSFASGASGLFSGGSNNSWLAQQQFQQQMAFAREQFDFQKNAAQMGVRWRTEDAKAAGIHPLYAIGAPSFNPSPINVGPTISGDQERGPDYGGAFARMGQGLERAYMATRTKEERQMTIEDIILREQNLERSALSNDLIRAQIASIVSRTQRDQVGPPFPTPVTAATNQAEIKPNEITSSQGDVPHAAAGPVAPQLQWRQAPDGSVYGTPEKNLQMDDMGSPGWLPFMYRNHILPFAREYLGVDNQYAAPPRSMLPPGATKWTKQPDGSWKPFYPTVSDREINRSRHGQPYPTPQYQRYR